MLRQYRSSSCWILPAAAAAAAAAVAVFCIFCLLLSACCWVLHAAAGFFLLLRSACCCWVLLAAGFPLGRKGAWFFWTSIGPIEPRSDPACLCRNPVLKLAIPLLAVSATRYHIALPIGLVRLHQASNCLLPTI